MKRFLAILVLGLLFISAPSYADDIRDFQLEGMSIGDSLLDYFSEEKIKKTAKVPRYKIEKWLRFAFFNENFFKDYEILRIYTLKKDKKYKIHSLSGLIEFPSNLDGCLNKKKEVVADIDELFLNNYFINKIEPKKYKLKQDKTNKSFIYSTEYHFKSNEGIRVSCYDWSKETTFTIKLSVNLQSKEFKDFLENLAFK